MHHLITIALFLFFFASNISAQNARDIQANSTTYRNLINYIPKSFQPDFLNKEIDSLTKSGINNIQNIWAHFDLTHSEFDEKLMVHITKHVSEGLFLDGKNVLLRTVGGYSGCPDKSVDTIRLNGIDITELQLCKSCTDFHKNRLFIETFNSKMYELLKIDPPTSKTESFYGEYKGFDKNHRQMKLILKKDRSFQFRKYPELGHGGDYTDGFWKHRNDTLILHSRLLKGSDSIHIALQSGKWVTFNNVKFILRRTKLKSLDHKKWKLKKEAP